MTTTKPQATHHVESISVKLTDVVVGERMIPLDQGRLELLQDSIATIGLLNPITVVARDDGRFDLVAGAHRLAAMRALGVETIPAVTIDAALKIIAEIDENLIRRAMSSYDEGAALIARRKICQELGEFYQNGGDRRSENFNLQPLQSQNDIIEELAARMGVKARTIHNRLWLATKITPQEAELARQSGAINNDALMRKIAIGQPHVRLQMFEIMAAERKVLSFKQLENRVLGRQLGEDKLAAANMDEAAARICETVRKYLKHYPDGIPQLNWYLTALFNQHAARHPGQP